MKILHLSPWGRRCGVADFTGDIVSHLPKCGIESQVTPLPVSRWRYLTFDEYRRDVAQMIAPAARHDLVHVQHEFSLYFGPGGLLESIARFGYLLDGLKSTGVPVVVTIHTAPAFSVLEPPVSVGTVGGLDGTIARCVRSWRRKRLLGRLATEWRRRVARHFGDAPGGCRALVFTPRTRCEVVQSGFPPAAVSVVPLGYTLRGAGYHDSDPIAAKRQLGYADDAVVLTMFGFVSAYKGHLTAVRALKKLPARYCLAVVGGPNLNDEQDRTLDQMLELWEGEDPARLRVTGYATRDVIDRYHAATDICLAPFSPTNLAGSASSGWALTSGKPTLASNIPALAEIHEVAGCFQLFTPGAVHELAWQIERLAADRALGQELGRRGLQFAAQHSWDNVVEQLVAFYRQMTGRGPVAAAAATGLRTAA